MPEWALVGRNADRKVSVGDTVKIRGHKSTKDGTVEKIGRKLVYIRTAPGPYGLDKFRMDTQRIDDRYGHTFFQTLEQYEEERRRSAVFEVLRKHRMSPDFGVSDIPVEKLERIVKILEEE